MIKSISVVFQSKCFYYSNLLQGKGPLISGGQLLTQTSGLTPVSPSERQRLLKATIIRIYLKVKDLSFTVTT